MIATTGNTTMLYCPKCRRTYEDGTQRFCDNDGGRLLPAPSGQTSESQTGGVFSNLLGKNQSTADADKKINSAPRFIPLNKTEESDKKLTSFPSVGRIFQSEQFLKPKTEDLSEAEDSILELDPLPVKEAEETVLEFGLFPKNEDVSSAEETPSNEAQEESHEVREELQKPLPRLIKPSEIASGTADVGDRKTNPIGREALSWDNPNALVGQTVKGRYLVLEELAADDEESLIYRAEDQIFEGKKVVVRVFMNGDFGADDFDEKVFAEERVSLSHLNHPNIAGVLDSGELPEGNSFIVSEFVEGKSLAEMLRQTGQFNSLRTARIIRQISYALSEAHQNGILHRNLKPENISLTVSEAGIEQVKLMNFGMAHSEITDANLAYKAPEEIERGTSTFASDIYSLAVIAYQMLTAHFPFTTETDNALLKAQKKGLTVLPTALRLDIQPLTDKILAKALAYDAAERYPKARDFGDAFFNALTTVAPWSSEDEEAEELLEVDKVENAREFFVVPSINQKDVFVEDSPITADIHITPKDEIENAEIAEVKATEDLAWEKRSPEPPKTGSSRGWLAIAGVIALLVIFWGASRLFLNRSNQADVNQNQEPAAVSPTQKALDNSLTSGESDIAPQQRLQKTPPNTQRFQNNRENLNEALAKNFLGFEVFYPQDWTINKTETNFLDVSKSDSSRIPIEQMIVTRYESRGTMTLDKPNFPKLVEKSNQDLKNPKNLGESYKVISEGDAVIQNGRWKVYEVKFQSSGVNEKGEKVTVWGKRLWLPVQRAGVQNGFVITLLATSLSETVKGVDDVGTKGELGNVLETFEPEQF